MQIDRGIEVSSKEDNLHDPTLLLWSNNTFNSRLLPWKAKVVQFVKISRLGRPFATVGHF